MNYESSSLYAQYQQLLKEKLKDIRFSWAIIKIFNQNLKDCMQFINMDYPLDVHQQSPGIILSTSCYLSSLRNFILQPIKSEQIIRVLLKTQLKREKDQVPKISLERIRMARNAEN